jgi:hypothetical protein
MPKFRGIAKQRWPRAEIHGDGRFALWMPCKGCRRADLFPRYEGAIQAFFRTGETGCGSSDCRPGRHGVFDLEKPDEPALL